MNDSLLPLLDAPSPLASEDVTPMVRNIEDLPLSNLVGHEGEVAYDRPLEDVLGVFNEQGVEFLALVREGKVTGICSRKRIGLLLGARYGFALHSRSPAHIAQVLHPLVFEEGMPLRRVLRQALGRHGNEFNEDVALVDHEGGLIGLIPVESLAHMQTRLVEAQLAELRQQHDRLQQQNLQLFKAAHAVRQAEALQAGLFYTNAMGVALLDGDGRVQVNNRRFVELVRQDVTAKEGFFLEALVVEHDRRHLKQMLASCTQGQTGSAARDLALMTPRGLRVFHVSLGWVCETGQICAFLDDVTERRVMERHLQGEEKQQMLDTLMGGIAHELNNKLTPVLGFAEILPEVESEHLGEYVGHIRQSVQEASGIIRQLQHLSKPQTGEPQQINLASLLDEALIMLKFRLRESNAEVKVLAPEDPVLIQADPGQLKQVVINLALNALDAMAEESHAVLEFEVKWFGSRAFLSVRDCGTGIPQELLGRIFDPYFTTKAPDRGSGLGLSISASLVRQWGGEIEVQSEAGQGSCFTIGLPISSAIEKVTVSATGTRAQPKAEESGAARRVLVVDDEPVVRNLLQEMLRLSFGCKTDGAADGREGLERVSGQDYDLIISDIRMPRMDGPAFYRRLRETAPAYARRFVFVSGFVGDRKLVEEIDGWGVPIISKPFTGEKLTTVCSPFFCELSLCGEVN